MNKIIIKLSFVSTKGEILFDRWLESKKNVEVVLFDNPADADYIIINCSEIGIFKDVCLKYQDKILISLTGEALSPDFNLIDYAISFDPLVYNDRYVKLPIPKYKDMYEVIDAKGELGKKTGFCNFIYSNKKAHKNRDEFFYMLSKYKKVDSLGEHLCNVNKRKSTRRISDWFNASVKEKSPYKFSIAFENAQCLGYTTEKIQSSMLAKTIPIYWGDPEVVKYYNPKSFINCNDYNSFEEVVEKVKELDNDDNKYINMLSQPWQTPEQIKLVEKQHEDLERFWDNIFLTPYKEAFRKPVGNWPNKYKRNLYILNKLKINVKNLRSALFYIKFKRNKKIIRIAGITFLSICK